MKLASELEMDFSFQLDNMYRRMRRLICFDMDSTLIETEVIDELADRAGVGPEVRAVTESAMRGEIDFTESFTRRIALLRGLDVSVMEEIARRQPMLKILVVSGLADQESIMRVLQLGAAGFVPKSLDTELLSSAIDFVLKGGVYIPSKLLTESQKDGFFTRTAARLKAPESAPPHLTDRQLDVLAQLAKGAPIKRICRELDLSEGTVKTHVAAIYRSFGASNRTEALIAARRAGFDIDL